MAREPLAAILQGADAKLMVQAILVLAEMGKPKAAIDLVGPCVSKKGDAEVRSAAAAALRQLTGQVPTRPEAIRLLRDAATMYFHRRQPVENAVDDRVDLWQWDADKRQATVRSGTSEDAERALAARFARQAYALDPGDHELRLLYLATLLDTAAYAKGLDRPWDQQDPAIAAAKSFGVPVIDAVLEYAMAQRHPAAAAAAARLLGELGKAGEVLHRGDQPAPLVQAVQDPDRRLRMAALEAIVRLQPSRPFGGSSCVPAALGFFAASTGVRHALVAGPSIDEARTLAGMVAPAGFAADTATTGKELVRLATRSPDYELAWIDVSIGRPEIGLLLQELRRDPRTALLRVGLMARSGYLAAGRASGRVRPAGQGFFPAARRESRRLAARTIGHVGAGGVLRLRHAAAAGGASARPAGRVEPVVGQALRLARVQDALLVALYNRRLAAKAVAVLANLNAAESQRALVEVASRFTQPLDLRQAAAAAFCENRAKHGILLTTEEIRAPVSAL